MKTFEWVVRQMMTALCMSARDTGTPTVSRDLVTEAGRCGVCPVRAERAARLRLALQ